MTTIFPAEEAARAAVKHWQELSAAKLQEIAQWCSTFTERPVLSDDQGYPLVRFEHVTPVERMQTRPLDIIDESMPPAIRQWSRIDWVTENAKPVATARPYGSQMHGARQCSLVYSRQAMRWWIYIPGMTPSSGHETSRLLPLLGSAMSPMATVILDRSTFEEVARALLAR